MYHLSCIFSPLQMKAGEIKTEVRLGRTATEGKRGREKKRERERERMIL